MSTQTCWNMVEHCVERYKSMNESCLLQPESQRLRMRLPVSMRPRSTPLMPPCSCLCTRWTLSSGERHTRAPHVRAAGGEWVCCHHSVWHGVGEVLLCA